MRKGENALLNDAEACDLIHQLIHWGYDKEQIIDAYDELEDKVWERELEDNFTN
jgi:hypothetical protein